MLDRSVFGVAVDSVVAVVVCGGIDDDNRSEIVAFTVTDCSRGGGRGKPILTHGG